MKKLFFVLTVCIWNLAASLPARAADCRQYKVVPEIKFSTSYGKLVYDVTNDRRQLTALGEKLGIVEHGLFASGLATIGVNYQVSVNAASRRAPDGTICVIPTEVEVFIGYQNPIIYISNDLQPGSCEYNLVLRHEQTHQQINVTALEYFIPKLQQASKVIINNVNPLAVTKQEQVEPAIQELIGTYAKKLEPLIDFFKKELLREQSKLDNPRNYQMEGNLCRYYNAHH